jgi:hypothetical protein
MAHFAQLTDDGIVTSVLVINNSLLLDETGVESEARGVEFCRQLYGSDTIWKQTSYNETFRKHFAAIGYVYDDTRDAFIPIQPYPSWILDEITCNWVPPTPYPADGRRYYWDEPSVSWMEVPETDSSGSH